MDNEIREAIKHFKEFGLGGEQMEGDIKSLKILLSLASDYLAHSRMMPKEKMIDDIIKDLGEGYSTNTYALALKVSHQARHECILALMKRVSVEKIEQLILHNFEFKIDFDPTAEGGIVQAMRPRFNFKKVAQSLYQSIIGEEEK